MSEFEGHQPLLRIVDEAPTFAEDQPLPGVDVERVVGEHLRADGRPHPGDPDYRAYCELFADVTFSLSDALEGTRTLVLFSRRQRLVDALWRKGYRRVKG